MSRLIRRDDIVDYETYEDSREQARNEIFGVKRARRVHLGENLTFLFENRETLTYQVQEIMRAEKIVRESAILAEIDVYNQMLGEPGELGCVLLVEIPEAADRKPLLRAWRGLESAIYLRFDDGSKVYAEHDPSQVDDDRLSAVQCLRFRCDDAPVAIGTDFEALALEVELTKEQMAALTADLAA